MLAAKAAEAFAINDRSVAACNKMVNNSMVFKYLS
jgi:hypothetical protein